MNQKVLTPFEAEWPNGRSVSSGFLSDVIRPTTAGTLLTCNHTLYPAHEVLKCHRWVNLKIEEANLSNKIKELEFKNSLLSTKLDLDYIETLIREKFMFGKEGETLYIIKKNDN